MKPEYSSVHTDITGWWQVTILSKYITKLVCYAESSHINMKINPGVCVSCV